MAKLINNAGVQHYANKMVLAENRKVGSKSLPTALNDIDNLIDEMKTHFDAEYGSALDMKLNNNENIFSVGTGIDIDKRSEVENSFTDVELKGDSLVNLWIPSFEKNTLQNPADVSSTSIVDGYIYIKSTNTGYFNTFVNGELLKPNTEYTVMLEISKNTLSANGIKVFFSPTCSLTSSLNFSENETGKKFSILTTGTNPNGLNYNSIFKVGDIPAKTLDGELKFRFLILEGNYSNKLISEYFEGIKSIGEKEDGNHKIEILLQNKNLFNYEEYYKHFPSTKTDDKTILSHSGDLKGGNHNSLFLSPMKVTLKPNTTYTFCLFNLNDSYQVLKCEGCLSTKQSELGLNVPIGQIGYKVFTTNSTNYKDGVSFKINTSTGKKAKYKIMIVEGDIKPSNYIHYDSNKKEILLNEPLRGLPNGIKDTIEKVNGEWKIVRRCGEEALTNNTTIEEQGWSNQIITKTFAFTPSNFKGSWTSIVPICNTFITGTAGGTNGGYSNDIEGCFCDTGSIVFRIDRTKLVTEDVLGFKEWLSQNPTKVIYELGTPIIEDISPLTMQCWKNGTISIDEVLPVESTHTVALNKPAQIKRNIEELTALRNKVQALEEQYDKIALEQAHQLSLINHSIELDYNI